MPCYDSKLNAGFSFQSCASKRERKSSVAAFNDDGSQTLLPLLLVGISAIDVEVG